jgi:hypothetical protein
MYCIPHIPFVCNAANQPVCMWSRKPSGSKRVRDGMPLSYLGNAGGAHFMIWVRHQNSRSEPYPEAWYGWVPLAPIHTHLPHPQFFLKKKKTDR